MIFCKCGRSFANPVFSGFCCRSATLQNVVAKFMQRNALIFGLSMTDYPNSGGRELRLPKGTPTETGAHVKQRQWLLAFLAIVVGLGALIGGHSAYWGHRGPQAPTE